MNGEAVALRFTAGMPMRTNQQTMKYVNAQLEELAQVLERAAALQLGVTDNGARTIRPITAGNSQGTISA